MISSADREERPAFYFLICPDADLAIRHMEGIVAKYPPHSGQWGKKIFWGDEEPEKAFWQNFDQHSFFAACNVVLVRRAQEWAAAVWKNISAVLSHKNEGTWPFFCLEGGWEKGKMKLPAHVAKLRCMAFAENRGWIWKNPGLTPATVGKYVEAESKKLGLKFQRPAFEAFCQSVQPFAGVIHNELSKLALGCDSGEISLDMISRGNSSLEADAFGCIRKLESGDLDGAWRELSRADANTLIFYLIAIFSREMRNLWQIAHGANPYMPADSLARKRNLVGHIGLNGIAAGFSALADAEWNVKSGRLSPGQALEVLVMRMFQIYGRRVKNN